MHPCKGTSLGAILESAKWVHWRSDIVIEFQLDVCINASDVVFSFIYMQAASATFSWKPRDLNTGVSKEIMLLFNVYCIIHIKCCAQ